MSVTTSPGPGMPSCAATPLSKSWRLLRVGSHTMRAPSPSATSTAAGFTPPTSRSQQMPPKTPSGEPPPGTAARSTSRCTAQASEAVGESCDFSTTARCPAAAASNAASNASTERGRCGSGPK